MFILFMKEETLSHRWRKKHFPMHEVAPMWNILQSLLNKLASHFRTLLILELSFYCLKCAIGGTGCQGLKVLCLNWMMLKTGRCLVHFCLQGGGGLKAIIEHCKCMYGGTFKESCQAIAIISIAHISTIHERMWNVLQPSQWVNWVPFHYIELVVWDIRGGFSATPPWCFSREGG